MFCVNPYIDWFVRVRPWPINLIYSYRTQEHPNEEVYLEEDELEDDHAERGLPPEYRYLPEAMPLESKGKRKREAHALRKCKYNSSKCL